MQPGLVDHRAAYEDVDDDDDVEYDELEEDEEPHHSWLGGSMAAKFLLAGGVAGAGKCFPSRFLTTSSPSSYSFADMYSAV